MRSRFISFARVITLRSRGRPLLGFILLAILLLATGCFNSAPIVVLNAFPILGVFPLTVVFDASGSYDPDGTIASYEWEFGDGGVGSGAATSHTYTAAGVHSVRLTVRDNNGTSKSATCNIFVGRVVPYDDLFRYNESYVGDVILIRGKIIQVAEKLFGGYVWRVATGESEWFGYVSDIVWINYEGERFLEGDIVDVFGEVKGLRTYIAVLGQQVTVPELDAFYVELVE